ncbi:hypothetical protein SAMN05216227_104131 [Pseudorhodobacter antarcticus]|uniref:Uncharacterized protein n=1 Tax=Pseudorhodobacter antarcticus TaxID=1077947 RepID=A0A1H8LFQ2_9RHOB|nr:hypothetical protein SAMN05216227_104131 [Pseudorhodobacter antarcticus]
MRLSHFRRVSAKWKNGSIRHDNQHCLEATLALINEYGTLIYLLLFGYCALKSGSLPLFGGYAAQAGALDVGLVAVVVFAGGYLGDEARFAVARR